ncbi:hypothetical protein AMJ87_09540 [candidate division WOR_3 bacterium SM23_60]|uniref:SnoaL-like domain-containing protein n=1 Tax=candidate division WOR_3 bacterium SM23_60 TaxID=1703780 RepID=A0A0S8GBT8_UNCW3|nr:MAG: hypothetical protein AMJ87_09540 [candidate division WOR_3 bacterium SM23_60]
MKCTVVILLGLFLAGCEPAKVDTAAETAAVNAVLDSYMQAVVNEDMEAYSENVAHDAAMVNFGGFGDPISGWAALQDVMEQQNAALSETHIEVRDLDIHVSPDGKLAWATCLWTLTAKMGEDPITLSLRCTWVLEKRADKWVIVHFHKSMAAG